MTNRCAWPLLVALIGAATLPAHGGDLSGPKPRVIDPVKEKAREAERQRLVAKLRADAPKPADAPLSDPLDAPIFHRHDRR